jgi:hypothetical protein
MRESGSTATIRRPYLPCRTDRAITSSALVAIFRSPVDVVEPLGAPQRVPAPGHEVARVFRRLRARIALKFYEPGGSWSRRVGRLKRPSVHSGAGFTTSGMHWLLTITDGLPETTE